MSRASDTEGAVAAVAAHSPRRRSSPAQIVLYLAVAVAALAGGALGYALLINLNSSHTTARPTAALGVPGPRQFEDTLASNTHNWLSDNQCFFKDGAYHALPGPGAGSILCVAPAGTFADFDLHVTAQETAGPLDYPYGLAFRRASAGNFYTFMVDGDGLSWFGKYADGRYQRLSPYWAVLGFPHRLNAPVTLRVVAKGADFSFFVHDTQVGTASDTSYAGGAVGVFSGYCQVNAAFTGFGISDAPQQTGAATP